MRNAGMNMVQVKKRNRSSVLNCINQRGPVSRKDIADITGLTPAAVTLICGELMEQGLLRELGTDTLSTGAGRRKVLVDINYDCYYILTVNIESADTVLTVSNMRGDFLERETVPTARQEEPEVFLDRVAEHCDRLRNRRPQLEKRLAGVSVAVPGVVDRERGVSVHAYGVWDRQVAVCDILAEKLKLKVWIENNVNALAMAELLFGMGRAYDNLLVIKWGPGVGSAIVIDSQLYEGRHGKAAELGHYIVEREGRLCSCGRRGCLETKVSYRALSAEQPFAIEDFGKVYREASAAGKAGKFEEAIDLFARTVVNSMTILAPNRVVLFGSLFRDGTVRRRLIEDCKKYDSRYDEGRILYSTLADRESYIGPVALFVHSIL
ncbi:MAG: ROK family transcriptional regulator [bacterium]|nr:ROK family transcriptional regulator [bacterium]